MNVLSKLQNIDTQRINNRKSKGKYGVTFLLCVKNIINR